MYFKSKEFIYKNIINYTKYNQLNNIIYTQSILLT